MLGPLIHLPPMGKFSQGLVSGLVNSVINVEMPEIHAEHMACGKRMKLIFCGLCVGYVVSPACLSLSEIIEQNL